jgi:hypothetical protein
MGYHINWNLTDRRILQHPLYLKWSVKTMGQIISAKTTLASDMGNVIADDVSAPVLSYLSWLAREIVLITSLTS